MKELPFWSMIIIANIYNAADDQFSATIFLILALVISIYNKIYPTKN